LSPLRQRPHGATKWRVVSRDDPRSEFEATLDRIFIANEKAGVGPTHIRALAKEMVRLQHGESLEMGDRQVEQWRRSLRRYMSGDRGYTEATRGLIARALRVEPEDLPAPRSRSDQLQRQVEELTRQNEELLRRLARRGHS